MVYGSFNHRDGRRRATGGAGERCVAGDQRNGPGRHGSHIFDRNVDGRNVVFLPMERGWHADRGGDGVNIHPSRKRCREHADCRRHGNWVWGHGIGYKRGDSASGIGDGGAAGGHPVACDQWNGAGWQGPDVFDRNLDRRDFVCLSVGHE